ncbi:hypothetical protein LDL08_39095 [Nonomuraea glycinis]|uniref:Uncharacterized protein n=1 Tax=Nonomuraea glycinis TaxID=2047744 RepID=A0A918A8D1_9ACTN|nr:hypothetical protein [Nonomuraea glycinis]MCA2182183.1 hypothetical protein [Nonomuraea glycinis]GGP11423.1 hypothetical protein GCM10012278_54960 [Nonomuraea glycinis]
MAEYPARNPFPARGTSIAEETSLPDFLRAWAQGIPTVLLPGVRAAERRVSDYLREFGNDEISRGGIGWLYGAHGVGKTHAARHMMAFVNDARPQAVQLYLKFQEDDFVLAYRRLIPQLSQSLLTDLSLRYLGTLAGDRAGQAGGRSRQDAILSAVADDPTRVYDLFGAHQVELGEVLEEQAKEISAVAGNGQHFERALSYLLRPEFSTAAYDWLCGRPIDPDDSRALGVSGRIDDPVTCRYGLQVLATLVTRSGRPFVLVLDQCEKFLLEDGAPVGANVKLLQALVEMIPGAQGMLLLLSSEAGWEHLPPDLRDRIGTGDHHLRPLSPDEAELVLRVYINTARKHPADGIEPFTESGLLELLRRSGGNIRHLLQLSWASFDAAAPSSDIDAELVATATARHSRSPGLAGLATIVENALVAAGLPAERVDKTGRPPEFLIPDRRSPRALIRLSEAVFYDHEVANALEIVDLVEHARRAGRPMYTAILVTGYVSPPVLAGLREAVRVLVADGSAAFSRELEELVREIAAGERLPVEPGAFHETLRTLNAKLEELGSKSRSEAAMLRRDLADVAERLEREEARPPSDWPIRRAELTDRIAQARNARAEADWAEFRRARADVMRERRRRFTTQAAAGVTAVLLGAISVVAALSAVPWAAVVGAAGAVGAGGAAVLLGRSRGAVVVHRAGAPLENRRDLDVLARGLRAYADPHAADPVGRYAYALKEDPDENYRPLTQAMLTEPLALVRQAIGRRLAVSERTPVDCVTDVQRALRERIPEALLLLARRQRHAESDRPPRSLRDLPPELRIIVALANPQALTLADGALSGHPAESVLAAIGVRGSNHPLAQAFRRGRFDEIDFPRNELRAAARVLSPFEPDGLGTYDWLPLISAIDELYLLFEEMLYHTENPPE